MQLAFEALVREGVAGQLCPADSLTQMIYHIYRNRPRIAQEQVGCRVIIRLQAQPEGQQGVLLSREEAGQFLLELLVLDSERVGELVYDRPAQALDYVLEPVAQGYRLTRPAQRAHHAACAA
jgi:hypothetical protein